MVFDFEKMAVYQASLTAIDQSVLLIKNIPKGYRHLADQLKRAISSVSQNIAEGVGEFKPAEKARFYRMALRSASESCSIIQICYRLQVINGPDYQSFYDLLTNISKMLTKLIDAMEKRVH